MKTALTCALFGILFFGSQCSSEEGSYHAPMTREELYRHAYENYTGLCGSWYRNESSLESIYNCTLKTLDGKGYPIVNKTWEGFRLSHNFTIPQLVGFMCNFGRSGSELGMSGWLLCCLCCRQLAHLSTMSEMSLLMPGHQHDSWALLEHLTMPSWPSCRNCSTEGLSDRECCNA
uniref:Putative transposase strongylocentrotus purpuratus: similar to transposase n=1 Tax=Ixodes ricinus TaxID=34613 RepID=A0A0K8RAU0_IXORI